MKKKILSLIAVILCIIVTCFAGCNLGSYIDNGNQNTPSNGGTEKPPVGENPPEEDISSHYIVNVYHSNNTPFSPGRDEVTAVWRNDDNIVRIELDANGYADAGELEGDYAVYLEGLPEKYTYDCNDYRATDGERFVTILLNEVTRPANYTGANGKGLYIAHGCYSVVLDGTYRAEIDGQELKIEPATGSAKTYKNGASFYEYTPDKAGYYSIVSKVNVYDDEVNPYIDIYKGTHAYKWFDRTIDGGGATLNGGFTKNFRYEVRIPEAEVGNSFTFAVYALSKSAEYPVNVDFTVMYEGAYSSSYDNVIPVRAEEKRYKAEEAKAGEQFVWADLGKKVFDADNYRYNPLTECYHYYNQELFGDNQLGFGKGYGPRLMCAIKVGLPTYSLPTVSRAVLYNLNAVFNPGTGAESNYLLLYKSPDGYYFPDIWPDKKWSETDKLYGTLDYTEFIRTDYGADNVCNKDGYCYVTKELMTFLTRYADSHSLYSDGVNTDRNSGTPEVKGYYAEEDAMWLFSCGFYYKGGTSGLNADLGKIQS